MLSEKRKSYTKEFKLDVVRLVTEQGYNVMEAARNLGVHHSTIRRWKRELESDGTDVLPGKGYMSPEKEELHRLRKENKRLRMEREIVKKAAAFFAKESS